MDASKLVLTARDLTAQFVLHMPGAFKPHVDSDTSDPFMPRDPWELLESGQFSHVPKMHGYNLRDNSFFMAPLIRDPSLIGEFATRWEEILAMYMFLREAEEITEEDREAGRFYLDKYLDGKVPSSPDDLDKLGDLVTLFYQVEIETFKEKKPVVL